MIRCLDNQINASFIDVSRIKWLFFFIVVIFLPHNWYHCKLWSTGRLSARTRSNRRSSGEASKTMDYKSVFTNLCLELQRNGSWIKYGIIKGLGKNPQKSELIHWRQCLLSGGTEACSLGHQCVYTSSNVCHSHEWRVDTASGKTLKKRNACSDVRRLAVQNKIAGLNGLRSEGVN